MLKLAVIDGNAVSRNVLASLLAQNGYEVVDSVTANSAGIASVIKLRPQLVCVDVGQADHEGLTKLDTIRNGLPKALLFMVSSALDAAVVQTALQRGVHGFVVKPFNAQAVLSTIRNTVVKVALQHQRQMQATQADGADEERS